MAKKPRVFVSTLDQQDVDVIRQTLGDGGAKDEGFGYMSDSESP